MRIVLWYNAVKRIVLWYKRAVKRVYMPMGVGYVLASLSFRACQLIQ